MMSLRVGCRVCGRIQEADWIITFVYVSYQVFLGRVYWPVLVDMKPFRLMIGNSDSH